MKMDVVDFVEAGLDGLLRSVLQRLRSQFGSRLSYDDLLAAARRAVAGIQPDDAPVAWNSASRCTVEQAQRVVRLRRGVRVIGTIVERSAAQILTLEEVEGATEAEAISVRIADSTGESIWSLDVTGAPMLDKVHAAWRAGSPVEALGVPIALPVALSGKKPNLGVDESRKNIFLALLDVRPTSSVLDLLGATHDERQQAAETLEEIAAAGSSATNYLFEEVIDTLGVVGLDAFPLLGELMRFDVLQALSAGSIDHASARLHGLVIGPPGRGKKLVGLGARILNPVTCEMSPAKASPAGLVGASYNDGTGWKSTPGLLARASHGVARLQDAHGWSPALVRKLAPILQEVMEDGVVRDAVAGGVDRLASCGLLIDANRNRHVGVAGESALLSVRPVLSRADLLAEIPPDADQAWSVGRAMIDRIGSGGDSLETDPRVRALRVLVATLRDRVPHVDLGPVRDRMRDAFDGIRSANVEVIANEPEAGDLPARLVISLARFASASARGGMRAVAIPSDVDAALPFVSMKLKFLRMNKPKLAAPVPAPAAYAAEHAGVPMRAEDLAAEYTAATGEACSERTMRRHLRKAGANRVGPNLYLLPAAAGTSGQSDSDDEEEES
jgi:hypothetical protein